MTANNDKNNNKDSDPAHVDVIVSPLPSSIGRLDQAKRFALMNFDKWNDVTGFVVPHTSYYIEICACIEDAVEFGFGVAHGQNWKTILQKIKETR